MNESHMKLLRECVDAGEKATQGEWRKCDPQEYPQIVDHEADGGDTLTIVTKSGPEGAGYGVLSFPFALGAGRDIDNHNGDFYVSAANAREALKAMLAEYEAMQAEIARLREVFDEDCHLLCVQKGRAELFHRRLGELVTSLVDLSNIHCGQAGAAGRHVWDALGLLRAALQNPKEPTNGK